MKNKGQSLGMLIMLCCALLAATARAEVLAVRNCTWCHGGSARTSARAVAASNAHNDLNMSQSSLPISAPTHATTHFRDNICGGRREISMPTLYGT